MHDLILGVSFIAMLMLPSLIAVRSGKLTSVEDRAGSIAVSAKR